MTEQATAGHIVTIETRTTGQHGYPHRATCLTCGWVSRGYVARHAAQAMADDHHDQVEKVTAP